jgi:hypothetical protein
MNVSLRSAQALGGAVLFLGVAGWIAHELRDNVRTGRFVNYIGGQVTRDATPIWFWAVMAAKALVIALFGFFAWLALRALVSAGA